MRRVLTLAIAGGFTLLLSARADAQTTMTLTANLSGSNEAPAVAATGAGGTATVVFNLTADTATWTVDVYNLPTGITAGHIHVGGVGVAGPVVINFTVNATQSNDFRISGTAGVTGLVARAAQGINSWD